MFIAPTQKNKYDFTNNEQETLLQALGQNKSDQIINSYLIASKRKNRFVGYVNSHTYCHGVLVDYEPTLRGKPAVKIVVAVVNVLRKENEPKSEPNKSQEALKRTVQMLKDVASRHDIKLEHIIMDRAAHFKESPNPDDVQFSLDWRSLVPELFKIFSGCSFIAEFDIKREDENWEIKKGQPINSAPLFLQTFTATEGLKDFFVHIKDFKNTSKRIEQTVDLFMLKELADDQFIELWSEEKENAAVAAMQEIYYQQFLRDYPNDEARTIGSALLTWKIVRRIFTFVRGMNERNYDARLLEAVTELYEVLQHKNWYSSGGPYTPLPIWRAAITLKSILKVLEADEVIIDSFNLAHEYEESIKFKRASADRKAERFCDPGMKTVRHFRNVVGSFEELDVWPLEIERDNIEAMKYFDHV